MKKTKKNDSVIPVVIAFDHNFAIIAGVCITSLFYNAGQQDAYRVICLIDSDVTTEDRAEFKRLTDRFAGHEIVFMEMGDSFTEAYISTNFHITKSTYYRLLIPRILSEYKKVIYADVDIIFRGSLHDLYFHEEIEGLYLGAVKGVWVNLHESDHLKELDCPLDTYFNAGFLLINIEEINKDRLTDRFMELVESNNYKYMDQDALNVACKGRVRFLSPKYNGSYLWSYSEKELLRQWTKQEIAEVGGIVRHYFGPKPWVTLNLQDANEWWLYYWRTPFLDKRAWMYYTRYPKISIKLYFYVFKQIIKWIIRYK